MNKANRKARLSATILLSSFAALIVLLYLAAAPLAEGIAQTTQSNLAIENSDESPLKIVSAYAEDIIARPQGTGDAKPRLVKPKVVLKNNSDRAIAVYELEFRREGSDSVYLVRTEAGLAPNGTDVIEAGTIEKKTTFVFADSPAQPMRADGNWAVRIIVMRFEDGYVLTLHPMPIRPPVAEPSREVRREPIRVGGNIQESKLIKRVEPVYPEIALLARVQDRVILVITVDAEGNVIDAKVKSGHPLLNDAAVAAVMQWKYSPTLLNGEPVPVIATVTVQFNLK